MAGSYPDVPGYRFAYDVDGTVGIVSPIAGGAATTISSTDLTKMNQNSSVANQAPSRFDPRNYVGGSNNNYVALLFPETRTITGYMLVTHTVAPTGGRIIQTSQNTTNGTDGTWTTQTTYPLLDGSILQVSPVYRSNINSVTWNNVSAVRWSMANVGWGFHFYGSIANTESPDRLQILDITNNDIAAQLDFGNLKQRATSTRQFKVKNNSATLTANSITVNLNIPSDASPSILGQYQISTDNVAFANAINIGTLAPGAESGILYFRMNPASNAQLGPWSARLIAHPTSWS